MCTFTIILKTFENGIIKALLNKTCQHYTVASKTEQMTGGKGFLSNALMFWTQAVGSSELRYRSVIWGPTCDCIDKLVDNYWIPELHIGDWLLIDNMGAYTVTSCTDFNGFERAQIHPVVSAKTLHAVGLSTATLFIKWHSCTFEQTN